MRARLVNTPDFGAVAAARRGALGRTQQQVADQAGVTREWLARFEAGAPNVTVARVMRVYRALDLDLLVDGGGPDE